jgi:hypothetical protein
MVEPAVSQVVAGPILLITPPRAERIVAEEEAMAEVSHWRLTGDWFGVCRCRVPCG